MKNISIIGLLFVLLLFSTCSKDKDVLNNPQYIGYWKCTDNNYLFGLLIKEDGYGEYNEYINSDPRGSFSGKVKISGDKLKIGIHTFKIIQEPSRIDTSKNKIFAYLSSNGIKYSTSTMKLEGPSFYMGTGTYGLID